MKIFRDKMFALLSIIKDSLEYIESRNDQGEKRFHTIKQKNLHFLTFLALLILFITSGLSVSHLRNLFMSFSLNIKIMKCLCCKTVSAV